MERYLLYQLIRLTDHCRGTYYYPLIRLTDRGEVLYQLIRLTDRGEVLYQFIRLTDRAEVLTLSVN